MYLFFANRLKVDLCLKQPIIVSNNDQITNIIFCSFYPCMNGSRNYRTCVFIVIRSFATAGIDAVSLEIQSI